MSYISADTTDGGDTVLVWERGPEGRTVKQFAASHYFYTENKNGEFNSIHGRKLKRHDFGSRAEFIAAKKDFSSSGIKMYESDISSVQRVLSEHYYGVPAPKLNVSFYDIEVDYDPAIGFSSVENPYAPISSIAFFHEHENTFVLYAVPPTLTDMMKGGPGVLPKNGKSWTEEELYDAMHTIAPLPNNTKLILKLCKSEKELLHCILAEIEDTDAMAGWNSEWFDFPYIHERIRRVLGEGHVRRLEFAECNKKPRQKTVEVFGREQITYDTASRIVGDYLALFKKYEMDERASYKLESIADEVCPDLPKLHYEGNLASLYRKNFPYFLRYNLRDTEVLDAFEKKLGYMALANEMFHLSCGTFSHVGGTIKLAELAIVNYCHHTLDVVVPDNTIDEMGGSIQGAYVLSPKVGMHDWIGSIDINSLYPSAIRSINISPETLIGQFVEKTRACEEIAKGTFCTLALQFENGETLEMPASEWREILLERKWAVSGYGTVFTQKKKGIIPAILEEWYATRKKYQKLKAEALDVGNKELAAYYDRLQYVYKIKLNSLYGALNNKHFRFYDLRMGESTTGTGRMILVHQCAKANEVLTGVYDPHGDAILYGDSVGKDTKVFVDPSSEVKIETLFKSIDQHVGEKEYHYPQSTNVLTYDETTNKTTFKPIKYVMRHKTNKRVFRVHITNTEFIDVTEDHSLIGYKNTRIKKKHESHLVEIKPQEMNKEVNSVVYLKHIPQSQTITKGYTKETYELLGLVVGDGHAGKVNEGVCLSVGSADIKETEEHILAPLKQQGLVTSWFTLKHNGHDVRICGTKIFHIIKDALYASDKKDIPGWMDDETQENIASFLRGYFTADGTITGNKVVLCSVNDTFIRTVQRLLFKLGISSTISTETTENSFRGKYSNTFTKRLIVKQNKKFKDTIGFALTRKQNKIPDDGRQLIYQRRFDFATARVQRIEEILYTDYVYDIEVEDTHVFFANNILVHNTDSTYFDTGGKDEEESVAVADAVATKVNNSFRQFMKDTFLCTEEFSDIIKAGREVVASRGIFVDKKRYVLRVVDSEGTKVDKLKVMGLDTKKTTLPKPIAKKLNKYVERLLKGESWDTIATDIVEYKTELEKTDDILTIGLPKGVNKVEIYASEYKLNPKTRLPGHVSASLHYNQCLDEFEDKESVRIMTGMKIKVYYLKTQHGRFGSIALPTDMMNIPNWFMERFAKDIDRVAQIDRLINNPMDNIIKAINKSTPTKQSLFVDALLEF